MYYNITYRSWVLVINRKFVKSCWHGNGLPEKVLCLTRLQRNRTDEIEEVSDNLDTVNTIQTKRLLWNGDVKRIPVER